MKSNEAVLTPLGGFMPEQDRTEVEKSGNDAGHTESHAGGYASREEKFMAEGPLTRLFFTFAMPGICGILFISLQTLADGILLGHFVGAAAMASVNVALPCISFLLAVSLVVGVGCETVVSIGMGRGQRTMANDAFTSACIAGTVFACLWGGVLFVFAPQLLTFMGADASLLGMCIEYARTLVPFFPVVSLLFVLDYVLKSLGRPMFAVSVMTVVVVLNVVLDIWFIAGLGWGVTGAALATGISYTFGVFVDLIPLCSGKMPLCLQRGGFRFSLVRKVAACGSAEGFSELSIGLAIMLFNIMLARYAGPAGIAAFTILNYMQYVAMATFLGLSDGIRPVLGYNFGRKNSERVRGLLFRAVLSVVVLGVLFGSALFFGGGTILQWVFNPSDVNVVNMATEGSRFMAAALALQGLNMLAVGYFTSIGQPRVAGMIAVLRSIVLVGIGLLCLPPIFGLSGIWMVPPLAEAFTLLVSVPLLWKVTCQASRKGNPL